MKHIIVGTAGHVDHGKTSLIRNLTGRDTDTLQEEKKRGISINLGFTFFDLPSKRRAGIIDVPGHEKFIKNMLAGIAGVDIVLMVIAADEGIMPQTKEHLEILKMLGIEKGLVVLTKVDLVDEEWLELVKLDIEEELSGTFLEGAEIHEVSNADKSGVEGLIKSIDTLTEETTAKDVEGHFRLPVDRAFSVSGFGTVVTGTIISGTVSVGDNIEVYPKGVKGKVRSIQIHGESSDLGEAGQRCAINIANVKVEDVQRGSTLASENLLESSMMVDCKLYWSKDMDKALVNRQRVRVYHGTDEVLARVVILDKEEIEPGEEGYVQLRLEDYMTTQRNDRFVIRTYSPMITAGGGTVLEPVAIKAKRFNEKRIEELKVKESGDTSKIIENIIKVNSKQYLSDIEIVKALGKNEDISKELIMLLDEGNIFNLEKGKGGAYVHKEFLLDFKDSMLKLTKEYHNENPLKVGISKEEVKTRLLGKEVKQKIYDSLLKICEENGAIKCTETAIALTEFNVKLSDKQDEIRESILQEYLKSMYTPPKVSELISLIGSSEDVNEVHELLVELGEVVKAAEDIYFLKEHYENGKEAVVNFIKENGSISAGESRELFNTNRKYAVALLEKYDFEKVTKRNQNKRILY